MKKVVAKSGNNVLAYVAAFFVVTIWGTTFVQTKVLINAGLQPEEIFLYRGTTSFPLRERGCSSIIGATRRLRCCWE